MTKIVRLMVLAGLLAGLLGFGAGGATTAQAAPGGTRLFLDPPNGSGMLSGHLEGIDPSLAFVTLTLTLRDGSNRTINVDSSTGWLFSFGVLPPDGFVSIALTENPIPMPVYADSQWNYGYLHGYFYGYPLDGVPWNRFNGYNYPVGYGWGYYPFGYYAYAQRLYNDYRLPYFWNYAPIRNTPNYLYYGIAGVDSTYFAPQYAYSAFGTITQPYFVQNYSLTSYDPHFTLPNPVYISNTTVAPYLTPSNQPSSGVMGATWSASAQNVAGTNLYQGNGATSTVPAVNLPQYAANTAGTTSNVAGTNLYTGQTASTTQSGGVPTVNLPQYAAKTTGSPATTSGAVQTQNVAGTNLYQGSLSGGHANGGVPSVNLPQYAPKPAPATPATSSTTQPGTNLWQGNAANNGGVQQTNIAQYAPKSTPAQPQPVVQTTNSAQQFKATPAGNTGQSTGGSTSNVPGTNLWQGKKR